MIAAERQRQIESEGWTPEHDDQHNGDEIALAAVCYAAPHRVFVRRDYAASVAFVDPWPWSERWDRREYDGNVLRRASTTQARVRQLAKAGALIAAEIDRLQRTPGATGEDVAEERVR